MATFDAKSNEFLVNNNVLSNYQHTEHISTTEPLYLDGMAGSDNIVHKPKRSGAKASFGDYLLSDLKTIVAQADLKDDWKADVVGICIGQNPVNNKLVFWNVISMTDPTTFLFYTGAKFDATKFATLSKGEGEPLDMGGYNLYVNRDVFGGEKGYIMATAPMSIEGPQSEQYIVHYGEFGGLQNTIEWYKQASAAGITLSEMPALNAIMQLSGVESMDDNYNLWFLGSMGHILLLCGEDELEGPDLESIEKYNALSEAVSNLGKTFMGGNFWSSSFANLFRYSSSGHYLYFWSNEQGWGSDDVVRSFPLFALIEVPGAYVEPTFPDPYNGHEYVDLGLPSGTLWATMNVGATTVTDYGNYYMYGKGSKTYDNADTPYAGTEDPLTTSADTAAQEWGGDWHMPTKELMSELDDNTTYLWVEDYDGSGINGGLFTAQNGNSIFLPAAGYLSGGSLYIAGYDGYYWGSSPNGIDNAYILGFEGGDKDVYGSRRETGYSVRPVVGNSPLEVIPAPEVLS